MCCTLCLVWLMRKTEPRLRGSCPWRRRCRCAACVCGPALWALQHGADGQAARGALPARALGT